MVLSTPGRDDRAPTASTSGSATAALPERDWSPVPGVHLIAYTKELCMSHA